MRLHLMHDLETLSIQPNAMIVSLGAVLFHQDGIVEKQFYQPISLESQPGRHIDVSTVKWWLNQSEDARAVFFSQDTGSLPAVLRMYQDWLYDVTRGNLNGVWSNGSDFDNVVLTNAYNYCEADPPWRFYQHRCYRTIKNLYPDITVPREGIHHNALHDAIYQATHLIEIVKRVGLPL